MFDEAVVEWMQEDAARREPLAVDKIREDLKSPFPKRKRTSLDAKLDFLRWTDEMLKAGYPSARKGTPAVYDPMSTVAIHLTPDEIEAILTKADVARTKKLRPRLEAMVGAQQDFELVVDEWARVISSLCGRRHDARIQKQLMKTARKIAERLSEVLGVEAPPSPNPR